MSETFSKVEVITGVARRRRFTTGQKLTVVNETLQLGMSISYVARRHGLSPSLVFQWRRLMSEGASRSLKKRWTSHGKKNDLAVAIANRTIPSEADRGGPRSSPFQSG